MRTLIEESDVNIDNAISKYTGARSIRPIWLKYEIGNDKFTKLIGYKIGTQKCIITKNKECTFTVTQHGTVIDKIDILRDGQLDPYGVFLALLNCPHLDEHLVFNIDISDFDISSNSKIYTVKAGIKNTTSMYKLQFTQYTISNILRTVSELVTLIRKDIKIIK